MGFERDRKERLAWLGLLAVNPVLGQRSFTPSEFTRQGRI